MLSLLVGVVGCSGDDDSGNAPPRRPDTGYGVGAMAPSPPTCDELCARLGDCAEHLCNEDSHSTRYDGLGDLLSSVCSSNCTASTVASVTPAQWQCYFADSCRQVFDYAECPGGGSYNCH